MLAQALDELRTALESRPDKNMLTAWADVEQGRKPSMPPISIGRQVDPEDAKHAPPEDPDNSPQARMARTVRGMLKPLKFENPVRPLVGCGIGVPTMATAFGVKPYDDPQNPAAVQCHLPLEHFDGWDTPDPATAGCMPKIKEQIDEYKALLPPEIKVTFPDMQGPFNIAHIILGSEIFYAFTDEPDRLHRLLQLITDFMVRCYQTIGQWIGPERTWDNVNNRSRIAECSVNLIGKDTYREFVLPYDKQLGEFHGELAIHPCSGPHVFEVTLDELPNVKYTECGIVDCAFAGAIDIDSAIGRIDGRPIILSVGQELEPGREESTIRSHLDRLDDHAPMVFGYTGMYWKRLHDRQIIDLHRRLDDYYMNKVLA
jgi:hypothetical protein